MTNISSPVIMTSMNLSIIHPCFNEEENIARTVQDTLAWFDAEKINGEVIVVNDGSSDRSADILDQLAKKHERVLVVTHKNNLGYGLAVRSGCDNATKQNIAFVDSDGQFRIEDLSTLLPHLSRYNLVTGRRRKRADSFVRNMFGKILGVLIFLCFGMWIRDVNCGMKVFTASLWQDIRPIYGTEKFFNTELYLRLKKKGERYKQIDVPHYPRRAGNPTGGSGRVMFGMLRELWDLRVKF